MLLHFLNLHIKMYVFTVDCIENLFIELKVKLGVAVVRD